MKHKPTTKKYTPAEFLKAKYAEHVETCPCDCDKYFYRDAYSSDPEGFAPAVEVAKWFIDGWEESQDPGNHFICDSCQLVLEYEYFGDERQEKCMDCDNMAYCCHFPSGDWGTIENDPKQTCDSISYYPPEGHDDDTPCTCEEEE